MFTLELVPKSKKFCYVGGVSIGSTELALSRGDPADSSCFEDLGDARIMFDVDHLGVALSTVIGNQYGLLIIEESAAAELRAELRLGPSEVFRVTFINHKGRQVKTPYVVLNPLGGYEVSHPSSKFLRFETSGNIYACDRWVLDQRKLDSISTLPDLFRPRCLRGNYFVTPRFVSLVRERAYTNFHFGALELR